MTIEELKQFLNNLTVIEACKLALDLEDAWGVRRAGQPPRDTRMHAAYGAPMPRKLSRHLGPDLVVISYVLVSSGNNPLHLMKTLREHLGWGLGETKKALQEPEVVLLKTMWRDEAKPLVQAIEALGGVVRER